MNETRSERAVLMIYQQQRKNNQIWLTKKKDEQLTDLFFLREAKNIHRLQHLTIQLNVILCSQYRNVAIRQIAVATDVTFY